MKKIFVLLITIALLTGCGKVDKEQLIDNFINKVESSKSYITTSKMKIYNDEDINNYDMKVYYMDDDYFKVDMVNTINGHEQILLKDESAVYVVTPSLNKSYKFVSEWPYNSSQAYILNSLVKDIQNEDNIEFKENDNGYSLKTNVNYTNNDDLKYQIIEFDKKMNLTNVYVYDDKDIVNVEVNFTSIDYKANLKNSDFDINNIVSESCCNETSEETGALDDITYPLYIPVNTYLQEKEYVESEEGTRAILTFNGDKNFVLIEEVSKKYDEMEIIPVYGEPTLINNTIAALSDTALYWTSDNVDYYLASQDLSTNEILTIAKSITTASLIEK